MDKIKEKIKEHQNTILVTTCVALSIATVYQTGQRMKWRGMFRDVAVSLKELDLLYTVVEHLDAKE